MLEVGQKAPAFSGRDQDNKKHALKDYAGQWLLLYFYPKDDTPGCTTEACGLRDSWSALKKANAAVLGVSKDSVASHQKFADKYKLPFPLLADEDKTILEKYGVWQKKTLFGKTAFGIKRMSYLIDRQGKIAKIYKSVKPAEHAGQVLGDVEKFQ